MSDAAKPILLLDVDGVINAFAYNFPLEEADHDTMIEGFRIIIPRGTAERIKRLGEHFEMHWGTMWMEKAHPSFWELLDLGEDPWPHVDFTQAWFRMSRGGGRVETHKLGCVEMYGEDHPDREIVWVDDDISSYAVKWADERTEAGVKTKAHFVDPRTGLTDKDVEELIAWATK